jgi:acetylornithine deacetylase/succinyl-diaminopimelate desuccinylase-like protein
MELFDRYIEHHHDQFIAELKEFVAQPRISATGEGMARMAELTRQKMEALGAAVKILELGPDDPPVIYATLGQGERTLLIYNHYDVQPVDPLDLWDSPPFEPTYRDGKLFARGISDNKGNLLYRIQAIRAWLETVGPLPCKINWFIEGSEETGSPNWSHFAWLTATCSKPMAVCGRWAMSMRPTGRC